VGVERRRLTRLVIDLEFADDHQNPGASGPHLLGLGPRKEWMGGGVLFQDGEDPQLGALEITDDGKQAARR